ncbi:MAG: glycogen debranching protein [Chloroflexota bacterium]|nr:glycogen debranching protein [Chloroflexota bacterium]
MSDEQPATAGDGLAARAAAVLHANDLGGWTKAAPRLYPHQWSWDAAFIAVGWARLDTRRAAAELRTLFAAQWPTGMVPHIVFNPDIPRGVYFPDATFWDSDGAGAPVGAPANTSGICQPPVHAIAARHIWLVAQGGDPAEIAAARDFLIELYPRLLAWHRYLLTNRDPEGSGLITVYHPWESTDNSPRWDATLAAVKVGELAPYTRADLQHVADPSQRPTKEEYDRYLWLVEELKRARYTDATIQRVHPFQIKDVFASGILVAANDALLAIAEVIGAPDEDRDMIAQWATRGRSGLDQHWDAELGLCLDHDVLADTPIVTRTVTGFAPLIAGGLTPDRQQALLATFDSTAFTGHPDLRWAVPPSTSPEDPAFQPRRYWRGPTWPVITWLYWWSLVRIGETERAARLRAAALDQLAAIDFAEYVEPFTGEPLGSLDQSWTAAVALDWLAEPTSGSERGASEALE